jgi:hypothetical protein
MQLLVVSRFYRVTQVMVPQLHSSGIGERPTQKPGSHPLFQCHLGNGYIDESQRVGSGRDRGAV